MLAKFENGYYLEVENDIENDIYYYTVFNEEFISEDNGWTEYRSIELYYPMTLIDYILQYCEPSDVKGKYEILDVETMEEYLKPKAKESKSDKSMYYLIKNSTMWGMGGRSERTKVDYVSENKLKLTKILKDLFLEALDDPEVELINSQYTDEYLDVDDISDELEVQYKSDGMDSIAIRYVIVSDRDAKTI